MDHIFRPGDLCLVFCSRRWYNKCKALPAVLDISHFPFSLLTVQCISTYEFRQWRSSKGGHGIARASIKTWETCRVWKNRNCLSNKSLRCCCCKKWTQCPWITECYPAGLHPAVFTISTISKAHMHVTWHFNLDYEAVMFVIKFTCRQINQTILSFFFLLLPILEYVNTSLVTSRCKWKMAFVQSHLHVVQHDVIKFPSLSLINVSSMLGAELHKHPHTC